MIQRKQTLFLLLAVIVYVVCLFLPIAQLMPQGMGEKGLVYNLGLVQGGSMGVVPTCIPLFLLLAVSTLLSLVTIFLYKNRKTQINLCSVSMLFTLLWYVDYALFFFGIIPLGEVDGNMVVKFGACLPFVALILVAMARKGVLDDEKLVRAADRIR